MLHDVAIVGAGPVGATLALALADARSRRRRRSTRAPPATTPRGDRSLALSHGARLIFERLGVWAPLAATPDAVTPITAIDISQARRLRRDARSTPPSRAAGARLRRVVSRAAGRARRGARAHAHCGALRRARHARSTRHAGVRGGDARRTATARGPRASPWSPTAPARAVAGIARATARLRAGRDRREGRGATTARRPRLRALHAEGPIALLPEGDHYALVWTRRRRRCAATIAAVKRRRVSCASRGISAAASAASRRSRSAARFR